MATTPSRGNSASGSTRRPLAAATSTCELVKTIDKNGEPHFSCPCQICR
jgi:hypothetical protein